MSKRESYAPGPAAGAHVEKDGDKWTLVLVRQLRHAPELVWDALTDPAQLAQWAPFDASGRLAAGATVKLSTVGAPVEQVEEAVVKRADPPKLLEYRWGGNDLRWQLEPVGGGTRLCLWHNIDRKYMAWGAAGWHVCFDVLDHLLGGDPMGRIVGAEALKFEGWQRLAKEYGEQFKSE